ISSYLRGIQCPTRLVIAEPCMPFIDPALMNHRIALVPTLTLRRLPGTHHLHMETPEAVAQALRD
ncbi:MAG: hypothetical protein COS34_06350, partial [Lysobacterales bacterium CG02_land_8_20_14_3_00_62_12]